MTQSLRDFLNHHVAALRHKQAEQRRDLAATDRELAEALLARAAIDGKPDQAAVANTEQTGNEDKLTIKQMIVEVLGLMPKGAEAGEILQHINSRFKAGLERTSLSPQLSRLKNEQVIERAGLIWSLKEKGPAEAGPSLFSSGVAGSPQGSPTQLPAVGSIPTTSSPSHQNGSLLQGDRSAGQPPG